jgi:hypothetical protein
LAAAITLTSAAIFAWLGTVTRAGNARWSSWLLLVSAVIKFVIPNVLYPTVFPPIAYLAAAILALLAVRYREPATSDGLPSRV